VSIKYLPGLNALRFFAAFFVVISHANISIDKLGIAPLSKMAFLNKGADAVDFFFTLSGFLITYLLIIEINTTKTVSIKQFYVRRVFRIWPVYFLVVAIGFFLLGYIYPKMNDKPYFDFSIMEGLLLFILFLPNYAAKNFMVGLLHPLWSIGVEEQFYLFWAPLAKFFRNKMLLMIAGFIFISLSLYAVIYYDVLRVSPGWKAFFLTQKFYAMAIGSLFGYILYYHFDAYNRSYLTKRIFQLGVLMAILWHFLFNNAPEAGLLFKVLTSVLYGLLILNVSAISNKLIKLEISGLAYLGTISYGIYMYHMLVDYLLRFLWPKISFLKLEPFLSAIFYYTLITGVTIFMAALSYRYFEKFFLKLKDRQHQNSGNEPALNSVKTSY
jgi:peptidoglycan/LPS O-acetylase OafA/YrhL